MILSEACLIDLLLSQMDIFGLIVTDSYIYLFINLQSYSGYIHYMDKKQLNKINIKCISIIYN